MVKVERMATKLPCATAQSHALLAARWGIQNTRSGQAPSRKLGRRSVGITDHGNIHGAYELWSAAVNSGIADHRHRSLCDVGNRTAGPHPRDLGHQLDPDHRAMPRNPDDVSGGGLITHLTMWAEGDEGLVKPHQASSVANLERAVSCAIRVWTRSAVHLFKRRDRLVRCPSGIIRPVCA